MEIILLLVIALLFVCSPRTKRAADDIHLITAHGMKNGK